MFVPSLNITKDLQNRRIKGYLGLNQQLYDLGLQEEDLFNLEAIKVNVKDNQKETAF